MVTGKLLKFIIQNLTDHKAENVVDLDIRKLTDIADHMVICTGNSSRHVNALAEYLVTAAKHQGYPPLGVEKSPNGDWTLVDLNAVIVHIMSAKTREFYSLEKLWGIEIANENRSHS